jgi:hypothetical protein
MLGEFRIVLPRTWVGNAWVTPKAAGAAIAFRIPAVAFLRSGWPDLDQAYPSGFRPLAALGKTKGDAFTFIEACEPRWCESRMWTNTSLPPPSRAMKPKPLSTLNHFTVPDPSTYVPEDGPPDVASRKIDRRGVAGAAVVVIDAQHLGEVRPFTSGTNPNFEGIPRLHGVDAPLSEN